MKSIGLRDKNGTFICEGDEVKIKGIMGSDSEYKFDAIYKIFPIDYEGLRLQFVRLSSELPDSVMNSIPIGQTLSFKNGSLTTDYRNNNYDRLALNDTFGENQMSRTRWKEHHYTNDIQIFKP